MQPRGGSPDGAARALPFTHRALALAGLSGLAFAQPLLSDMTVGFFVAHRSRPLDLVALALILVLAPPAILLALESVVARVLPRMLWPLHVAIVGCLAAVAVSQLFVSSLGWPPRTLIGLAAGTVLAVAYWRHSLVRAFAAALVVGPVLSLASFLFFGPTAERVFVKEASSLPAPTDFRLPAAPVVLVVFDELPGTTLRGPDGRIERRFFPNFARVADQASWYPNATSVHNSTARALPAILTGRVSPENSQPTEGHHPNSVFTLLADRYDMNVREPFTQVCPLSICPDPVTTAPGRIGGLLDNVGRVAARRYLPNRLARRAPSIDQWRDHDVQRQVERFEEDLHPGRRPGLHVLHTLVPHQPWRYLPDGRRYPAVAEPESGIVEGALSEAEWPAVQRYQRHVLQTQYADRLLGQLVDRMQSTGLWDDSLVVVAADHGVSIRPGNAPRERPDRANFQDVMSVPFLVKEPSQQRGRLSRRFVQIVDIVPTIADVLGVNLPWKTNGESVLSPEHDRTELTMHVDDRPSLTVDSSAFGTRAAQSAVPRSALLSAMKRRGDAFSIGPFPELLDHEPPPGIPDGPGVVSLISPNPLPPPAQGATEVPAQLAGRVEGLASGQALAVEVGGRIVATTRVYPNQAGGLSVSAMLSPAALRAGGPVSMFTISRDAPRLARVRVAKP